ncbi:YegS/Rv2252/BmrU family lipid kinase [Sporosalibacterium faouarense]|uniref:YegS/Rv2252/BmrU family lipid kinase n=1 Tax=Sporosalibacterium faouarense TaxID=516123 RepID=UPI00141CF5D2|nr:YegS/Rv2252/BmrU family lipid kinase [Sporosalibacterium faouarense]MTI49331.1 YegS/Rv2252/BmrU family lipid kinase [Bacillota bacterium]
MKIKLIYNPISGDGTFKNYLDHMLDRFQSKSFEVEFYRTSNDQSLDSMIAKINEEEYQKIIVAGGDGTINKVVNGLIKYNINIPLGIIPVGTSNGYAQYFNLPNIVEENAEILLRNNYTYSDIGCINNEYFVNVASLGRLIDISQKVGVETKNSMGVMAYYLKGITELPKLRAFNIIIKSKELKYKGKILFMLIMNGKSAGGFSNIAPSASINDGVLEVFIFKKCPIYKMVSLFLAVINGEHVNNPSVIHFRTNRLFVDSDADVSTDLDGEKGPGFPLNIRVAKQKIKIITRYNNEDKRSPKKNYSFYDVKKVFGQLSKGVVSGAKKYAGTKTERNVVFDITKMIMDLPRHNTFNYVNQHSLGEEYFKAAEGTLNNGYIYIVLSSTGSIAGETIAKVTNKHYSHSSLSFDEELKTIVSYNGGEKIYSPGLNVETLDFLYQKEDANVLIYRLEATYDQKKQILDKIKKINEEGSSYNVIGLFLKYSHKRNIMFCSQFIYTMLKGAGLDYFSKKPETVKPTDFVELDYERKLEFCGKVFIKDIIQNDD